MIHVDRSRVSEPDLLKRIRSKALPRLRKHYAQSEEYRSQRRYPFREGDWKKTINILHEVFSSKCAYCEVRLTKSSISGHVEHFRPKAGARGLDAKHFHSDHYWWLAYDWENLLLACRNCNQSKRDLFPVKNERQRARPEARLTELEKEPRLILDPVLRTQRMRSGI